ESNKPDGVECGWRSPNQQQPERQLHLATYYTSATQVRRQVMQAVKRHDYRHAIAMLNCLITCHPDSAADYSNRGLIYFWSGQPGRALKDLNRAISLNPELAGAYNNRANYYAAQGNLAMALQDYDQAIDLDPFHAQARINRAVTLRELGYYADALEALDETLVFHQLTGEVYAERGRTYHLAGEWNAAIADYRQALRLLVKPTNASKPLAIASKRLQLRTWLAQLQLKL
ncbi:MAG: tetratricopeptide repeat protein, partial [Cyanobacteria bacterium P01_H01_bin.58]